MDFLYSCAYYRVPPGGWARPVRTVQQRRHPSGVGTGWESLSVTPAGSTSSSTAWVVRSPWKRTRSKPANGNQSRTEPAAAAGAAGPQPRCQRYPRASTSNRTTTLRLFRLLALTTLTTSRFRAWVVSHIIVIVVIVLVPPSPSPIISSSSQQQPPKPQTSTPKWAFKLLKRRDFVVWGKSAWGGSQNHNHNQLVIFSSFMVYRKRKEFISQ
jgi:hypothetical protein